MLTVREWLRRERRTVVRNHPQAILVDADFHEWLLKYALGRKDRIGEELREDAGRLTFRGIPVVAAPPAPSSPGPPTS